MAIEDEIINISDIDIGTEILNSDKLLIETSNGTKMIAFKDFVVGPDNISSVRQNQIEGGVEGEADTFYNVVTGFNILNNKTTPGLNTQYDQISGTTELGVFNYNAIANLASVSADIGSNTSAIRELNRNIDHLANLLESTNNDVLKSVTLQTSACNCIVAGATGGRRQHGSSHRKSISFSRKLLDPVTTNPNCTVELSPFKLKFPVASENSGFVDGTRFMIVCKFDIKATNNWLEEINIFRKKADGTSGVVSRATGHYGLNDAAGFFSLQWTDVLTINSGDELTATANNIILRGDIDIFKIG